MANPVDFPIYFPAESMEDTHIRWGGSLVLLMEVM